MPSWQAGIERNGAVIDISTYPGQKRKYLTVRSFLEASTSEQEDILAWANRSLDAGEVEVEIEYIGTISNPVVAHSRVQV